MLRLFSKGWQFQNRVAFLNLNVMPALSIFCTPQSIRSGTFKPRSGFRSRPQSLFPGKLNLFPGNLNLFLENRRLATSFLTARCFQGVDEKKGERFESWEEVVLKEIVDRGKFDRLLAELSDEQRDAVTAGSKVVRVVAGPGSGKTRVLISRVAFLMQQGVKPENILVLTFTNKAADEMKERLARVMGPDGKSRAKDMWAGTFHSIGNRILRRHIDQLDCGRNRSFTILDDDDSRRVLSEIVGKWDAPPPLPKNSTTEEKKAHRALKKDAKARANTLAKELYGKLMYVKERIPSTYKLKGWEVARMLEPDNNGKDKNLEMAFDQYHQKLQQLNACDFSDLLGLCVALLQNHPQIRKQFQEKFKHVLVDEVQDTNGPQYSILQLLIMSQTDLKKKMSALTLSKDEKMAKNRNRNRLFVVGDPNQAIYGWRGANMMLMLDEMRVDFEGKLATKFLRDNYRSLHAVVKAAESLLKTPGMVLYDSLNGVRGGASEGAVQVVKFKTGLLEAKYVVQEAARLCTMGMKLRDMAVLFRVNSLSRDIQKECALGRLACQVQHGVSFWKKAEIKDVMCFLRFLANPDDLLAFERIVNLPTRGVGPIALSKLQKYGEEQSVAFPRLVTNDLQDTFIDKTDVLTVISNNATLDELKEEHGVGAFNYGGEMAPMSDMGITKVARKGLMDFRDLYVFLRSAARWFGVKGVVDALLIVGGYRDFLAEGKGAKGDPNERLASVMVLKDLATSMETESADLNSVDGDDAGLEELTAFVESAILMSDNKFNNPNQDALNIMTIHGAKGLEFKVVFLIGCEEGLFPLYFEGDSDLEEETRVAFVGFTRAKDRLVLSYAEKRLLNGKTRSSEASRYLSSVPGTRIEGNSAGGKNGMAGKYGGRSLEWQRQPGTRDEFYKW